MYVDNRIFDINGDDEMLETALKLAFQSAGTTKCDSYVHSKEHGLILMAYLHDKRTIPFPTSLTATDCLPIVRSYLASEKAKEVKLVDWEVDADHDGHNSLGWRMYVGEWGHIGEFHDSICAIKRVFLWHGK